jgi:hypothetical protein
VNDKISGEPDGASTSASPRHRELPFTQLSPSLQEQMLLQGQVDAVAVFTATSYMNLVSLKLDPDKDFRWMYYSDLGLDLYSNGIMVSADVAATSSTVPSCPPWLTACRR